MPRNSSKQKSDYTIQTVANAFRILETFRTEPEIGVSDVARRLGLYKNNAFRLLATLESCGYVEQSEATELYRLSPRCLELGQSYLRAQTLTRLARPVLEQLAEKTGETAHLGTLSGSEVVHLDAVLPQQLVLTASRVGERLPAYCTALGKVLLGGQLPMSDPAGSAPERDAVLPATRPDAGAALVEHKSLSASESRLDPLSLSRVPRTRSTLVDGEKLLEALRTARIQGYAIDAEECTDGLCCVASPIEDAEGQVLAALSLSGPSFRLNESVMHGAAREAVAASASELSRALGAELAREA